MSYRFASLSSGLLARKAGRPVKMVYDREEDMAGMKSTAAARLADVDRRIAELERIRTALQSVVEACPGHGSVEDCPILKALTGEPA